MKKYFVQVLVFVLGFFALSLNVVHAQATRTWVSGVGDDANPCSRTAPCKTFAGAISKTAASGEIDALDPGGFGTITITQAITIDGGGGEGGQVASILASGGPGVTVNAGSADRVVLRNLTINGISGTVSPGTTGVNFIAGESLTVENTNVANFSGVCINFQPSVRAVLVINNSNLDNCAGGGIISSASSGGVNRVNLARSTIQKSGVAMTAGANSSVVIWNTALINNVGGGLLANASTAVVNVNKSSISNNQVFGVHAQSSGTVMLSDTQVGQNNGTGLLADTSGQILTWSNNWVGGNSPDGSRTGTVAPQ